MRALDNLDLTVQPGEIFGFLGPNGAGKSTAIRILVDLLRPTSGEVEVFGKSPRSHGPELRTRIGYLPGELRMPERASAGAYLGYLSRLRNGDGMGMIAPLAQRLGLDLTRKIGNLSKGNKQKVGLVQAFMHSPDLLILDEPTSGLDPLLQREFRTMAQERQSEGATVLISSHVLSEIEHVTERMGFIRSGRLVDVVNLDSLKAKAGQLVKLRFATPVTISDFAGVAGLSSVEISPDHDGRGSIFTCVAHGDPDGLIKAVAAHHVVGWEAVDQELEDLFMGLYQPTNEPGLTGQGGAND